MKRILLNPDPKEFVEIIKDNKKTNIPDEKIFYWVMLISRLNVYYENKKDEWINILKSDFNKNVNESWFNMLYVFLDAHEQIIQYQEKTNVNQSRYINKHNLYVIIRLLSNMNMNKI